MDVEKIKRELEQCDDISETLSNIKIRTKRTFDDEFDLADTNKNDRLSREEYRNLTRRLFDRDKRKSFSRLDRDHDGLIDWGEYKIRYQRNENLDTNKDGFISRGENEAVG